MAETSSKSLAKLARINVLDIKRAAIEHVKLDQAEEFRTEGTANISSFCLNPGLERGCKALQRFCKGYLRLGCTDLQKDSVYGWHGTQSLSSMISICKYGFDTKRRKRQLRGIGEYFGRKAVDSYCYASFTCHLVLVQILKGPHIDDRRDACIYIVDNPYGDKECTYSLPVMAVAYGPRPYATAEFLPTRRMPIPAPFYLPATQPPVWDVVWHWAEDDGNLVIPPSDDYFVVMQRHNLAMALARHRRKYDDEESQSCAGPICRCTLKKIKGVWHQEIEKDNAWFWRTDLEFCPYPPAVNAFLERHYQFFKHNLGSDKCAFKIPGKPGKGSHCFIVDYPTMLMTDVETKYQRFVERRPASSVSGDAPGHRTKRFVRIVKKLKKIMSKRGHGITVAINDSDDSAPSILRGTPAITYGAMATTTDDSLQRSGIRKTRANDNRKTQASQSSTSSQQDMQNDQDGASTSRANGQRLSDIADAQSGAESTSAGSNSNPSGECWCLSLWRCLCCRPQL